MVRSESTQSDDPSVTRSEFLREMKVLDNKVDNLALGLLKTQQDVTEIKATMTTKDDTQKVIEHIDAWAQRFESYDRKALTQDHRLNDHETRITRLESSAAK